jgi:hypothetical protein
MTRQQMNLISSTPGRFGRRVIRWTIIDAALGMVGGAIFGSVFWGFALLARFEPWQISSMAGYFALCGGAAGALVGMCGTIVDNAEATGTASPSACGEAPAGRQVEPVRESVTRSESQPLNRLVSDPSPRRPQREFAASQNPSWN